MRAAELFNFFWENGDTITSPYPEEWHVEVGAAFQANDLRRAIVSGIGEYSPDGRLECIHEIESFGVAWVDDWKSAFQRHMKVRDEA